LSVLALTLQRQIDELTQAKFFEEAKNMATLNKKVELLSDFEEVAMRTAKKEAASKMKADGMAPELIQKYTRLSLEEIAQLEPQAE